MAEIKPSKKYEMKREGILLSLKINQLEKNDSDHYTCDIGNAQSRALLSVAGLDHLYSINCFIVFTLLINIETFNNFHVPTPIIHDPVKLHNV